MVRQQRLQALAVFVVDEEGGGLNCSEGVYVGLESLSRTSLIMLRKETTGLDKEVEEGTREMQLVVHPRLHCLRSLSHHRILSSVELELWPLSRTLMK